jgi:hypothetical protein
LHGHREFGDDVLPDRIGEYDWVEFRLDVLLSLQPIDVIY